ncbi:TonB-dependent receptor [Telmatospirillum siberiense]|uniref:TonB-dependent receptor n=1 Tax=Telmatospirillum siberiense TaxID=382514 RepID=A0A2N3PQ27_9PROT|nr:TonB-dependent receptor [Telmatospirillum siberiense]PKU22502.1 hypothetical protein CWS72_21495 [Telmatospirillum siberiense]
MLLKPRNSFSLRVVLGLGVATSVLQTALADDNAGEIPDVVVTAQRRAEKASDTPISLSVIDNATLEKADIKGLTDLYTYTPSTTINTSSGNAGIYIRGVGNSGATPSTSSAVAVNVDDVYLARPSSPLLDFFDVERVEVLRGPQGTLYGRNATAGAINIYSARPTFTPEGYADFTYGSFNRTDFKAAFSGPVTDTLALRLAVRGASDDGYNKNTDSRGTKASDQDNVSAIRALADYKPVGGPLSVQFTSDYVSQRQGNQTLRPLDGSGVAQVAGAVTSSDFHATSNNAATRNNTESGGFSVKTKYEFDDVSLNSITGYHNIDQDFLLNTDGTSVNVSETLIRTYQSQESQEFRLNSEGKHDLDWVVGSYFFHENVKYTTAMNRYAGTGAPATQLFPNEGADTTAYAGFADGTYHVTDRFSLGAGIRYSWEDKDIDRNFILINGVAAGYSALGKGTTALAVFQHDSASYHSATPRFIAQYKVADNSMVYASVTNGFKSGGAGVNDIISAQRKFASPYANEKIWAYEIGQKSSFLDRKLQVNASLFWYDYTNLQVATYKNGLSTIQNAASASPYGAELEIQARPTDPLTLRFSGSYLHATYDSYISSLGSQVYDASGNTLIGAPTWTLSTSGDYELRLPKLLPEDQRIDLYLGSNYRSEVHFSQLNLPVTVQKPINLVDARITWHLKDGAYSVSIFGKNLLNQNYCQNIVTFTSITSPSLSGAYPQGSALCYPAEGRSLGIQTVARF